MPHEGTEAYATRLPADEAQTLEKALAETDQSRADMLRRAIRYYVRKNPDDVAALYPEGSIERQLAEDAR